MKQKEWLVLGKKLVYKARVFDLYSQRMRSPRDNYEDDYYYLDCPDWVVVIPITVDQQVVLVEQFRHGIHARSLEIPGGIMNIPGESPAQAASRELSEETGFHGGEIVDLGFSHPNPALQSNRCHFFAIEGVLGGKGQMLDASEDIDVHLEPLEKIPQLIESGTITHSLCISAFCRYYFKRPGLI